MRKNQKQKHLTGTIPSSQKHASLTPPYIKVREGTPEIQRKLITPEYTTQYINERVTHKATKNKWLYFCCQFELESRQMCSIDRVENVEEDILCNFDKCMNSELS